MNTYVNSFKDYAEAKHIRVKVHPKNPSRVFCRKCGARMRRVGDSNVYVCDGTVVKKTEDGTEVSQPCANTFIRHKKG